MEWSRSIIKTSACCFVDRDNIEDIYKTILRLKEDKKYYDTIIAKGVEELSSYPDIQEFVQKIFSFINKIANDSQRGKNVP